MVIGNILRQGAVQIEPSSHSTCLRIGTHVLIDVRLGKHACLVSSPVEKLLQIDPLTTER